MTHEIAEASVRDDERLQRLDAFGESLARTRSEAIAGRRTSGIEDIWLEDEEFYEGIDDANRGEAHAIWRTKPPGQASSPAAKSTKSTIFPNITSPFCDAAAARIGDMLLPTDDRSWAVKPTPVPSLVSLSKAQFPAEVINQAASLYPGQPQLAKEHLAQAVAQAEQVMAQAKEQSDRAQKRIDDWHVECQFHAHVRQVIEDCSRIGTSVLKGPCPARKKRVAWQNNAIVMLSELKPASRRIDVWNFYPDPNCGENIHNGSYVWERDYITRKQLRELKGQEGYIDPQIDACLEEGPTRATEEYKQTPEPVVDATLKDKYEIWYFHGTAEREDLRAAGCDCEDEVDPHVNVMVTMVNNRVVRASLNPLDTGEFPYDVMVWKARQGHWAGEGVAREIRPAQRIVTGATRNLMDNAGLGGGPMLVYLDGVVVPANGVAEIAPRKVWRVKEDADAIADATKAIGTIKVEILVNELISIIRLGLEFAEHVTGLPMLLQGQMGKAPETVGGMQLLYNNASAVLRRLARLFDDRITEPHVRRYYLWLLQYGPDDEKGDFQIDARGSSALVERDIQNQELMQMGALVSNPIFGLDPKKWAQEYLKSRHFDPKRFEFDDEKWREIVENMSKGPSDPRLAVAQLRADLEARLKGAELQFEQIERQKDRELEIALAGLDAEMDHRRQSGEQQMSLDDIKAMLAKTVMQLRVQRELSYASLAQRSLPKPPTEPAGRAPAGQAFQR